MSEQALMTTDDICRRYGVTRRTVYRWIDSGKLKAKRAGKRLYIDPVEASRLAERIDPLKVSLSLEAQTYLDIRECLAALQGFASEASKRGETIRFTADEISGIQSILETQAPEAGAAVKAAQAKRK